MNIRAGNPVSGYGSITKYVPYNLWTELDGEKAMIRDIALRSYEHGLLAENAAPFPVFVRHGREDGISLALRMCANEIMYQYGIRDTLSTKLGGVVVAIFSISFR